MIHGRLVASTAAAGLLVAWGAFAAAQPQDAGPGGSPEVAVGAAGQGYVVDVRSRRPALIAVRIRHDSCPVCRSVEADFDPVLKLFNERDVLLVTVDLSNEATQHQSALLIASLGLEELWPVDFSGVGSVIVVDSASRDVVGSVQTEDTDRICALVRSALGRNDEAPDAK